MRDCLGIRHDGGIEHSLIFNFTGRFVRLFDDTVNRRSGAPAWRGGNSLRFTLWTKVTARHGHADGAERGTQQFRFARV